MLKYTIAADNYVIHLQCGDVVKAIVGFIGVFFVFHVGFATPHANFLIALQELYLGERYEKKKPRSVVEFLKRFDDEYADFKELKGFKKRAVFSQ